VTESAEGVWVATGADKAAATAATLMQSRLQRTLMQLGIQPFTYRSRRRMMLMTADTRQCMGKRTCVPLPVTQKNNVHADGWHDVRDDTENLCSLAGYTMNTMSTMNNVHNMLCARPDAVRWSSVMVITVIWGWSVP
jgi:hypothetical protein